jgi:hypothetical protein
MRKAAYLATALVVALSLATPASGEIVNGDVLVFDIGEQAADPGGGTTSGNWNNMYRSGDPVNDNHAIDITDAIRLSDGATTGVGLRLMAQDNNSSGIGGADVSATPSVGFPYSGTIPASAIEDLGYLGNEYLVDSGSADSTNGLELTDLNDSLTYDISVFARITNVDRGSHTWTVNGTSYDIAPNNNDTVYTWEDVPTDGSGAIVIAVDIPQEGDPPSAHINALEVAAVPEPATLGLLGLGGLAAILRRRRA